MALEKEMKEVLYTWTTPSGEHRNQIDIILMKQK